MHAPRAPSRCGNKTLVPRSLSVLKAPHAYSDDVKHTIMFSTCEESAAFLRYANILLNLILFAMQGTKSIEL